MRALLAYIVSLVFHALLLILFVVGLFTLDGLRDRRLPFLVVALLLVAGVGGFLKGRRWPSDGDLPFALGVVTATLFVTTLFLALSWALTYPVGTPPPFGTFVTDELRHKNAGLWLAGPTVLTSLACLVGYSLGKRGRGAVQQALAAGEVRDG